jgi:3-hydroxy-5-methyl-1-naphthoate 3-O-methyltransferase
VDFARLEALSGAHGAARVLHAAVLLDLFPALAEGGTAAEVAAARGLDPRATELLLNAMAGLRLLTKDAGRFAITPAARPYLVPGSPKDFGGMIAFEAHAWGLWEGLPEAVRTGRPARATRMYQHDPAETRRFILAMDALVRARGDADWLAANLDFRNVRRLLDVGGGPGTYPIGVCRLHAHVAATVFDLPGTLAVTREVVEAAGLSARIETVAGDYHTDPLPEGFDLVLLSNVIHGEDEGQGRDLMARCYGALAPGGRIVVKDHILDPDGTSPLAGAVFSLLMLLTGPGRDYTFGEVAGWLSAAGFEAPVRTDLPPPFSSSLVVARRPA